MELSVVAAVLVKLKLELKAAIDSTTELKIV